MFPPDRTGIENRVSNLHRPALVEDAAAEAVGPGAAEVAAKSAVGDRHRRARPFEDAAAGVSRVAAQSAVGDRQRPRS